MQDDHQGVQGRNINPRKNGPDDDNPHVNPQDDMENPGQRGQQIAEKNHFWLLTLSLGTDTNLKHLYTWQGALSTAPW
jgi:hypothetical protein